MGLLLSKLFDLIQAFPSDGIPCRVLTILYKVFIYYGNGFIMNHVDGLLRHPVAVRGGVQVKLNENICTIPTIGFNVETFTPVDGVTFTVWDLGGQELIRPLWEHYYADAQGLMFVADSADATRLEEARDELHGIIKSPDMGKFPFVMVANKQDLPGAISTTQVIDGLGPSRAQRRH